MKKRSKNILLIFSIIAILIIGVFYLLEYFASISGILGFENRNSDDPEKNINNISVFYKSRSDTYRRDSLFIATTVWQLVDKKVFPYDSYKKNNVPVTSLQINVDSIIYSPDSLKLFAFVINGFPYKTNNDTGYLYRYGGDGFIGYRNSRKNYWTLYYFDQYTPVGFKKCNTVRNLMREYYLNKNGGKFKSDEHYYWDRSRNDYISIPFDYNIDDIDFWNNSIVWKKGFIIPGYYTFQIEDQAKSMDSDAIIKLPSLDYPDSLLQLYKK